MTPAPSTPNRSSTTVVASARVASRPALTGSRPSSRTMLCARAPGSIGTALRPASARRCGHAALVSRHRPILPAGCQPRQAAPRLPLHRLRAHPVDGPPQQPGDVHLRDADARRDLVLGELLDVAHPDDLLL